MAFPLLFHLPSMEISSPVRPIFRFLRVYLLLLLCGGMLLPSPTPLLAQDAPAEAPAPARKPWTAEPFVRAELDAALEEAKKRVEAYPAQPEEGSAEAKLKGIWSRRVGFLQELVGAIVELSKVRAQKDELPVKAAEVEAKLAALEKAAPPGAPAEPTSPGLEEVKGRLDAGRRALEALNVEIRQRTERAQKLPELAKANEERSATARETAAKLQEDAKAGQGPAAEELAHRLDNLEIQERIAAVSAEALELEAAYEKDAAPYRARLLEQTQKSTARAEQEFTAYQAALEKALKAKQAAEETELARKKRAAEAAVTPDAALLARWEAKVAEASTAGAKLETDRARLDSYQQELEKRLEAEKKQLASLQEMVKQAGARGSVAERLKGAILHGRRRDSSEDAARLASAQKALEGYIDRRYAIDDILDVIEDVWKKEVAAAAPGLSNDARASLETRGGKVREEYRSALEREKQLLDTAIYPSQEILRLEALRAQSSEDLEAFLLSQLIYIRDAKPLGLGTIQGVIGEVETLRKWLLDVASLQTQQGILEVLRSPRSLVLGLIVFALLPALLFALRRRLRRFVEALNSAATKSDGVRQRTVATLVGVIGASLIPLYLVALAFTLDFVGFPESLSPIFKPVFLSCAAFLFLWLLVRIFFGRGSIAISQFRMKPDTARALLRCLRVMALGFIGFLIPWVVLRRPPFDLEAIPRLGYVCFQVLGALPILILLRARSPLVRDLAGPAQKGKPPRFWGLLFLAILAVWVVTIGMEVMGYHYGSVELIENATLTLLTGLCMVGIYRALLPAVDAIFRQRRADIVAEAEEEDTGARKRSLQMQLQMRKFLRVICTLIGLLTIAYYWGLNKHALDALDSMVIKEFLLQDDKVQTLSVGDVFRALLSVVITIGLVRNLPGLYEITLFSRFKWDSGLRYALVTISRYLAVFVGVFVALGALHIDLSNVGLVTAGLGVGLGFGLQEIFSNFVSGLILLLERPVRVGDLVTVAGIEGEVRRINIRSTTILSFDRREVIIPNRDLITKEVTNWTLSDTVLRGSVTIGVAYGTDVERVKRLLEKVAREPREVLEEPRPQVLFTGHGESSLDFEIRFFFSDPQVRWILVDRLNTKINQMLAREGIEIPFPQRDLHLRSGGLSLPASMDEAGQGAAPVERTPEKKGAYDV